MENESQVPAGKKTVPPPTAAAASIALLMAGESTVLPSPTAPKLRTSKIAPAGNTVEGFGIAAKADGAAVTAAAAKLMVPSLRSSRRAGLMLSMARHSSREVVGP